MKAIKTLNGIFKELTAYPGSRGFLAKTKQQYKQNIKLTSLRRCRLIRFSVVALLFPVVELHVEKLKTLGTASAFNRFFLFLPVSCSMRSTSKHSSSKCSLQT